MDISICPSCGNDRFSYRRTLTSKSVYFVKGTDIASGRKSAVEIYCSSCGCRLDMNKGELTKFIGYYNIKDGKWSFSDTIDPDAQFSTQSYHQMVEELKRLHKLCDTKIFK